MGSADDQFRYVKNELLALRESFPEFRRDAKYLELFDEFVREYEFGLAFGLLCDFLLEPETPPISNDILARIRELHGLMKLKDDCIDKLKQKANVP